MRILALDLATTTGCADGDPSAHPRCWTWRLGLAGDSRAAKLSRLLRYMERYLAENRPDAVFYERGLPLGAAHQIGQSEATVALLRGAIGVVEAASTKAGVPRVEGLSVQEARRHLLGQGRIPAGEGKDAVWRMCRMLGWPVTNTDEADAACIWARGCSLVNPRLAYLSTPLFGS